MFYHHWYDPFSTVTSISDLSIKVQLMTFEIFTFFLPPQNLESLCQTILGLH